MTGSHDFDEALISGYLDDELTQGEAQRVRVHLEDCADCRATAGRLGEIKQAAMSTEFTVPDDTQWSEAPRTTWSGALRNMAAAVGIVWFALMVGVVLWQVATDGEDIWETIIVLGFWLAAALVLLSVLIDRLQTRKNDPYRRIEK